MLIPEIIGSACRGLCSSTAFHYAINYDITIYICWIIEIISIIFYRQITPNLHSRKLKSLSASGIGRSDLLYRATWWAKEIDSILFYLLNWNLLWLKSIESDMLYCSFYWDTLRIAELENISQESFFYGLSYNSK